MMWFTSKPTRPVKRLPKRPNFIVHWRVYSVTRTRRAPSSHRLQIGPGRQYERLGEWRKVVYFKKACPLDDQRNSELLSAANVNAFEDFLGFITRPSSSKPTLMTLKIWPELWITHPSSQTSKRLAMRVWSCQKNPKFGQPSYAIEKIENSSLLIRMKAPSMMLKL